MIKLNASQVKFLKGIQETAVRPALYVVNCTHIHCAGNSLSDQCFSELIVSGLIDVIGIDSCSITAYGLDYLESLENKNESIYPVYKKAGECEVSEGGLSKLDHFAGLIAPSILSHMDEVDDNIEGKNVPKLMAFSIYEIAEAMVEESNKRQSK